MFSRFILIAIFSNVISGGRVPCLSNQTSCTCNEDWFINDILCTDVSWVHAKGVVMDIHKNSRISLELRDVFLPQLPRNLFKGLKLFSLSFVRCNTSSVDDYAFQGIEDDLIILKISENYLEEVPSRAMEKLSNLKLLILTNNPIASLKAESFKGLRSLEDLFLSENKIKFIDGMAFAGLRLLDGLYLSGNELTTFPVGSFRTLNKLSTLNLSNNKIKSIHTSTFQGVERTLTILHLGGNQLKDIPTESLINLTRLEVLGVGGNSICLVRKDAFLPFGKTLELIFLQNNSLTHIDSGAFDHLSKLTTLYLDSNHLTVLRKETFAPVLDTLTNLYVHDNPLHCDCGIAWFRDWEIKNGFKGLRVNVSDPKCSSPEELRDADLKKTPADKLVCTDAKPSNFKCVVKGEPGKYLSTFIRLSSGAQGRYHCQSFMNIMAMLSLYYFLLYASDNILFK